MTLMWHSGLAGSPCSSIFGYNHKDIKADKKNHWVAEHGFHWGGMKISVCVCLQKTETLKSMVFPSLCFFSRRDTGHEMFILHVREMFMQWTNLKHKDWSGDVKHKRKNPVWIGRKSNPAESKQMKCRFFFVLEKKKHPKKGTFWTNYWSRAHFTVKTMKKQVHLDEISVCTRAAWNQIVSVKCASWLWSFPPTKQPHLSAVSRKAL